MMNDQAPILYYEVTGDRRKELVQALGEILLWEPKYQGAPSFSYHIGNYIVDRNGTFMCPDCVTTEIAEQLIQNLMERGFTPTSTTLDLYIISLPRDRYDEPALNRLRNLVKSKDTILRAALENKRKKLLEAHYSDAIPLDLMKTEQQKIAKELAAIDHEIDLHNITFEQISANLDILHF